LARAAVRRICAICWNNSRRFGQKLLKLTIFAL
jgi:hypothetical protein